MDTPSSTLTRASRPRRQKRRDLESESRLMEPHRTHRTHRTNHPYHYESLLRVSRQAPPHTTTSPSSIINVGSHEARKYRDLSDPRKHKSPALSLRPPQVISRLPRQNAPATYPYDAWPVTYWPSRDPIGEGGGINLYGMVANDVVGRVDYLGLYSTCIESPWKLSLTQFEGESRRNLAETGRHQDASYVAKVIAFVTGFVEFEVFATGGVNFLGNGSGVKVSAKARRGVTMSVGMEVAIGYRAKEWQEEIWLDWTDYYKKISCVCLCGTQRGDRNAMALSVMKTEEVDGIKLTGSKVLRAVDVGANQTCTEYTIELVGRKSWSMFSEIDYFWTLHRKDGIETRAGRIGFESAFGALGASVLDLPSYVKSLAR